MQIGVKSVIFFPKSWDSSSESNANEQNQKLAATIKDLEKWVQFIEDQAPESEVILFANKLDLAENRQVKESELEEFAKQNKYTYLEGSAKTGQSVDEAFSRMAELVFGKSKGNDLESPIQKPKEKKVKDKSGCC